jgi:hypothetical protein
LRVLYKLRDAGFMAFLVGGCVRDLLIGLEPKDFDVATDALPEQVKRLFRNCRLVGRRFRLAHVFFGREIIEVATFRAASAPSQGEEPLPDADPEDGEAPELDDPQLEAESLNSLAPEGDELATDGDGSASDAARSATDGDGNDSRVAGRAATRAAGNYNNGRSRSAFSPADPEVGHRCPGRAHVRRNRPHPAR